MVAHEVPGNAGEYPEIDDSYAPFADSETTLLSRILEVWFNAGGGDDRVQGLRDAEDGGCGDLPGVRRASLLRGTEGDEAGRSASLRSHLVLIAQPVEAARLSGLPHGFDCTIHCHVTRCFPCPVRVT